ncbi:MAG: hypothetical protein U9N30_08305, partial [Campylobacterota bacterium]|nr:hypothetical protein [Campylobacterota bacterium]
MIKSHLDALSYLLNHQLTQISSPQEYLDDFIRVLIKQLSCFSVVLFKHNNDSLETTLVQPKNLFNHYPYLELRLKTALNYSIKDNLIVLEKNYFHVFQLENIGYILIHSKNRKYHPSVIELLKDIVTKFTHLYVQKILTQKTTLTHKQLLQQAKQITDARIVSSITQSFNDKTNAINYNTTQLKINQKYNKLDDQLFSNSIDALYDNSDSIARDIRMIRELNLEEKTKNKFTINYAINKLENILQYSLDNNNIVFVKNINDIELHTYEIKFIEAVFNIFDTSIHALNRSKNNLKIIRVDAYNVDNKVVLDIQHNANLYKEEDLTSIFEPFNNTLDSSTSLGLALYFSENLISKQTNGNINVKFSNFTYEKILYNSVKFTIE